MISNKCLLLTRKTDVISDWTGKIFSFLVLPLTAVIVFEVIARWMFKSPSIWSFELCNFFFGAHFMLLAAYGLLYGSHVKVDIISSRFSNKTQKIFSLFGYLTMFFPFVTVILIYGIKNATIAWSIKEKSWSLWGPPLYPIKTVIPLTACLLLLQGISEVMKLVGDMLKKEVDE